MQSGSGSDPRVPWCQFLSSHGYIRAITIKVSTENRDIFKSIIILFFENILKCKIQVPNGLNGDTTKCGARPLPGVDHPEGPGLHAVD